MTRLLTLQLPVEVVADLITDLEMTSGACDATCEYLETGYCRHDVTILSHESPEEAEWQREFCRAVHKSIMAQLERQDATDLVRNYTASARLNEAQ